MSLAFFRLFVAIAIPETVRNAMAAVQQELKPFAPENVHWTNPEQLHLTLKFLGHVPAGSLAAVKQSLTDACAGFGPFPLQANGIGFFPNERRPRVIWVGFEDQQDTLAKLQMTVESRLSPLVEKPGTERFLPHATLGRFQKYRRHKTERLAPQARLHRHRRLGEWQVEELILFRSELSPDGARHTPVAVFPFGATLAV